MKLRPPRPQTASPFETALAVQTAPGWGSEHISIVQKIPEIIFGDDPGCCLSGASGAGKSSALEILLRAVVRSALQPGLIFLDPHGTSATKFYHWCLDQGPSVAKRVLYLHFADTRKIPNISLLHVPGKDIGSLAWLGRLTTITELVSKILLAAWGEVDFNSKPILFKFVFRVLSTLAYAGLPLADAKMFLNVFDPMYQTLCEAVPSVIDREEMLELPELRPADRMVQMDSGKNRFIGFLSNAIVENIVGRATDDGALTMEKMYADRLIVIVNLETGGVLRTMDQEILANTLLSLAIYTAMNTPEERRHPQVLAVDELPVFKSSSDILTRVALPQCRKYLLKTIACFQGTNVFPDGADDKLLQAFLALCGARFYFRHNSEADCAFFGRAIAMPVYSPMIVKYEHSMPMQFQDGNEIRELVDVSDTVNESDTETAGQATGINAVKNWSDVTGGSDSETFRDAVDLARRETHAKTKTHQAVQGGAEGTSKQDTSSQAHTTGRGHGITRKQQLVPIIKTMDIVTSVQFFTKEELDAMAATIIANQKIGQAIFHASGAAPVQVSFPYAADPFAKTPKFGKKKVAEHRAQLEMRPEFATIEQIQEHRQALKEALMRRLAAIAQERRGNDPELPPPANPDELPPDAPPNDNSF